MTCDPRASQSVGRTIAAEGPLNRYGSDIEVAMDAVVILPPDHPLAEHDVFAPMDLAHQRFIGL